MAEAGGARRKLSVVVGAVDASRSLARCLDALQLTCTGIDTEIIVVSAGRADADLARASVPGIRTVVLPESTLTPMLWAEGIAHSRGDLVAFTTGHCFVTPDWAASMLAAVGRGAIAAGGPMRLARGASIVDASVFFLRYSAFLEGATAARSGDIAGDNAVYVRNGIPDGSWTREHGFWEVEVNREILRSGGTIAWAPDAVAEFGESFTLESICRHRFAHGRIFGRARVSEGETTPGIVAKSPMVPLVLLSRIARRVAPRPRYRLAFMTAIPTILALASCWASGEAAGALDARIASGR